MMALFLVLWLTTQDTKVKEAVERAFRNPFSSATKQSVGIIPNKDVQALQKEKGRFDSVSAMNLELLRRLTEDLAKLLQQDAESQQSVKLDMTSEGLRINVFDSIHKPIFEANSATFTPYGNWVFSTLAWEISRYPTFTLDLAGHTEHGRTASDPSYGDWELSADRANATRRKLMQHGVAAEQVFRVSGLADTQPLPGYDATNAINRRVSMLLKIDEESHVSSPAATSTNAVNRTL